MEVFNFMNLFIAILIVISSIWLSGFIFGAPFETINKKRLKRMIKLAKAVKGDKIVDLGSGNGKIVIEFAKRGIETHGYEINPFLVWISKRRIKKLNLQDKAFIHWKNFMNESLSKYDIVCTYQIWYMMNKLEFKLKRELKKGAKIISNTWKFPNWKLKKEDKGVYLYTK